MCIAIGWLWYDHLRKTLLQRYSCIMQWCLGCFVCASLAMYARFWSSRVAVCLAYTQLCQAVPVCRICTDVPSPPFSTRWFWRVCCVYTNYCSESRCGADQDQGGQGLEGPHGDGLPLRDTAAAEPDLLLPSPSAQEVSQVSMRASPTTSFVPGRSSTTIVSSPFHVRHARDLCHANISALT